MTKGLYIRCSGQRWPLRTPQQVEKARAALRSAGTHRAPIVRWTGEAWAETALVLYSADRSPLAVES